MISVRCAYGFAEIKCEQEYTVYSSCPKDTDSVVSELIQAAMDISKYGSKTFEEILKELE